MENQSGPNITEMALLALASGTHRVRLNKDGTVELVEREEPDPHVVYRQMPQPRRQIGEAWVCPTPISFGEGEKVELVCLVDDSYEAGFSVRVSIPIFGQPTEYIRLYSEKDIKNGKNE